MAHPLVLPMAAHVALAALLYALLTFAHAPKVWGIGQRADGSYPWAAIEPRISANLSNQFEWRSEEHTSELQSLMRISYAVFCLKKTNSNSKQLITLTIL